MLKTIGILGSISSLITPISALSFSEDFFKNTKQVKPKKAKHLLYSFNNKIYEDKKEILRDFLLAHPNFITTKNVLGDLDKAVIDYDQNMLNGDLLSIYDFNKIKPVYKKSDGEFVKDAKEAQNSTVNPAFIRQRLTDGFNNYFSPDNGREAAINSYARRIFNGKIGVIKIDNFSSVLPNFYNPLSEDDFQNLKNNTINAIKDNPASLIRNGYAHKWINKKDKGEIKSLDDLFDGSSEKLRKFIETSFDKYIIMKQMYSSTNGFIGSPSNRDTTKIQGKKLDALVEEPTNLVNDRNNPSYSLVSASDFSEDRKNIMSRISKVKADKKNFENNKENNRFNNYKNETLSVYNEVINRPFENKTFSGYVSNGYHKGNHEFYNGHIFRFYFGLYVNNNRVSTATWDKYIEDDDAYGWQNPVLNFNYKNILLKDNVSVKLYSVWEHDGNGDDDAELNMRPVSSIEFGRIVKQNLSSNTESYDINDVTLHLFYDGSEERGPDHMKVEVKNIDKATFNIKVHYKYDNSYNQDMDLHIGKIYLNKTEWENKKTNYNLIYRDFLNNIPIKYNKNFLKTYSNKDFADVKNNNNFKFYKSNNSNEVFLSQINSPNKNHYLRVGIKYVKSYSIYTANVKYIDIPIEVTRDYDLEINNLCKQYKKIDSKNGYSVSSLLDYDENSKIYKSSTHILNTNLNGFNDKYNIYGNNKIIKMSYNQFKHFINIYDKDENKLLKDNLQLENWTNNLYIKANFPKDNIDELYKIPLEKIIKDGKNQLASLMDGRKATNDLQFIIDFSKMSLSNNLKQINNIIFKWSFKDNLSKKIQEEYNQFRDPLKKPFSLDISKLKKSSLENDAFYMVLNTLKDKVVQNPIWKDNSLFTSFIRNLDPDSYNHKVEERLDLNNHLLWKIHRNLINNKNNNLQGIDFIAQRSKNYKLKDFIKVLNLTTYEKKKLMYAIKNKQYDELKILLRAASLVNIKSIDSDDEIEFLAWNYFKTLKEFINRSSLIGSLPNKSEYEFPNLEHIFIGNQQIYQMKYLIDSEYRVNGQLIDSTKLDSIPQIYKNNAKGNKDLREIKKKKIESFEPPLVTQLFNSDGQEFKRSNKMNYDSEEITILNALWSTSPNVLKKHIFYKGKSDPILFQMHMVYHVYIKIRGENISYYFKNYDSAKNFVKGYIEQFIKTIDLDHLEGGHYA